MTGRRRCRVGLVRRPGVSARAIVLAALAFLAGAGLDPGPDRLWTQARAQEVQTPPGAPERDVRRAMVARAQRMLARLGYRVGTPDGVPGRRTRKAIRGYQKKAGLPVDGKVTQTLLRGLERSVTRRLATPAVSKVAAVPSGTKAERKQVARAQELLAGLGYRTGKPDGRSGRRTRKAIRDYEKASGLPADGKVTSALLKRLERSTAKARRGRVRRAQQLLAGLGYDPGPADGRAGAKTRRALGRYQKQAGLPVDGKISRALIARLEAALSPRVATAPSPGLRANPLPDYETGSSFVYSDGTVETVVGLRGAEVLWRRNDGLRFTAPRNFLLPWTSWQLAEDGGTQEFDGEPEAFWPRVLGREIAFSSRAALRHRQQPDKLTDWSEAWRCRLEGSETLTVAAGRFETRKLVCRRAAGSGTPALRRTWYYAPVLRHYVRLVEDYEGTERDRRLDLVAIRPGAPHWPPIARGSLSQALEKALETVLEGVESQWRSTGVATRVTITPTSGPMERDGRTCRTYLQTWAGEGGERRYPGAACRDASGRWHIPGLEGASDSALAVSGGFSS